MGADAADRPLEDHVQCGRCCVVEQDVGIDRSPQRLELVPQSNWRDRRRPSRAEAPSFIPRGQHNLSRALPDSFHRKIRSQGGKLIVLSDFSTQTCACSARSLTTTSTTIPLPPPGQLAAPKTF